MAYSSSCRVVWAMSPDATNSRTSSVIGILLISYSSHGRDVSPMNKPRGQDVPGRPNAEFSSSWVPAFKQGPRARAGLPVGRYAYANYRIARI